MKRNLKSSTSINFVKIRNDSESSITKGNVCFIALGLRLIKFAVISHVSIANGTEVQAVKTKASEP